MEGTNHEIHAVAPADVDIGVQAMENNGDTWHLLETAHSKIGGELLDQFRDNSYLSFAGPLLFLFSVYSFRFLIFPWLWRGAGLGIFIPVLSPVYRQAEHWQHAAEANAVALHICSGSVMLLMGLVQFDKTIRRSYPRIHRWSGRVYAASGCLCIYALRQLKGSVGAGSAPSGHSYAVALFIDVSSLMWILATAFAIICAIAKKFRLHRDLMALSISIASVPIAQRLFSWFFLAPSAMILRLFVSLLSGSPPASARFGPPGNSHSVLFKLCSSIDMEKDTRACPLVLSLDGYGEAEQSSFAVSAWLGLSAALLFSIPRILVHMGRVNDDGNANKDEDKIDLNSDLSSLYLCDVWRIIPVAISSMIITILSTTSRLVYKLTACLGEENNSSYSLESFRNYLSKILTVIQVPIYGIVSTGGIFVVLVLLTIFVTLLYLGFLFVPIYILYLVFKNVFSAFLSS